MEDERSADQNWGHQIDIFGEFCEAQSNLMDWSRNSRPSSLVAATSALSTVVKARQEPRERVGEAGEA